MFVPLTSSLVNEAQHGCENNEGLDKLATSIKTKYFIYFFLYIYIYIITLQNQLSHCKEITDPKARFLIKNL